MHHALLRRVALGPPFDEVPRWLRVASRQGTGALAPFLPLEGVAAGRTLEFFVAPFQSSAVISPPAFVATLIALDIAAGMESGALALGAL